MNWYDHRENIALLFDYMFCTGVGKADIKRMICKPQYYETEFNAALAWRERTSGCFAELVT